MKLMFGGTNKMFSFFSSKLFLPDDYQKNVYQIDLPSWTDRGIQAVFVDLDNTLIPYDQTEPTEDIKKWFAQLASLQLKVVLISNNRKKRAQDFAQKIGVSVVSNAKKPSKFGFKKALKKAGYPKAEAVLVIGDQLMTDVLGANRMGFHVVVVDAINRTNEKWFTRLNRIMEKRVLRQIQRRNPRLFEQLHLNEKR